MTKNFLLMCTLVALFGLTGYMEAQELDMKDRQMVSTSR